MNKCFGCRRKYFWNNFSALKLVDVKRFETSAHSYFLTGIPQNIITIQMSVVFWPISQCWKSGRWSRPPLLRGSSESEGLFPVCLFLQCLSQKRGKMKKNLPSNQARKMKAWWENSFLNSAALQQFPESPNQCSIPSLIYLTIEKSKLNAKQCCL